MSGHCNICGEFGCAEENHRCSNCKCWQKTTRRSGKCVEYRTVLWNIKKQKFEKRFLITLKHNLCEYYNKR